MSKKDAYVEKGQAKIDEQVAKINQFKAQTKGKVADKKIEAHEHIEKLEKKLETAKSHLKEIADSAEDAWEDLSGRFEDLADELSTSVKKFFNK
jgi:septation ring formation regulator EzrA|tara:strand:- start:417 stop:698 length:282 start_codon:yes stop_codon:yes gene_type:complete